MMIDTVEKLAITLVLRISRGLYKKEKSESKRSRSFGIKDHLWVRLKIPLHVSLSNVQIYYHNIDREVIDMVYKRVHFMIARRESPAIHMCDFFPSPQQFHF